MVFPSTQLRTIVQLEDLAAESASCVELFRSDEASSTTPSSKYHETLLKLHVKLETEATVASPAAANNMFADNGVGAECLATRGEGVIPKLRTLKEQLQAMEQVAVAFRERRRVRVRVVARARVVARLHVPSIRRGMRARRSPTALLPP